LVTSARRAVARIAGAVLPSIVTATASAAAVSGSEAQPVSLSVDDVPTRAMALMPPSGE
jgi:hypothetical protein